jgi:predicted metal-binding protein
MWFRKPAPVVCVVCGKAFDSRERRFVEKNRTTKIERHTHVKCGDCPEFRV